jgi:hypothetical protein
MDELRKIVDQIRRYLTPWVLLGAIGIALLFLSLTVIVIPAPTDTLPVPTTVQLPTPTPTSEVPPPPPPGVIAVGSFVQVTGTGSVGLRLRDNPGLESKTEFLGMDAEVFKITDGPQEADGYTWWHLVAPYDEQRHGWAVANYLSAIANP